MLSDKSAVWMGGEDTAQQNTDNESLLLEMCSVQNHKYVAGCFVYMSTVT